MQAGHPLGEQPLAHRCRVAHADLADGGAVVGDGVQPLGQLRRDTGAAQLLRAVDDPHAGDRHDAGDDRHGTAVRGHPVTEPQVVLGVEEHLGDGEVRPGPALADEVLDVGVQVGRARVLLREGSDADAEVTGRPDEPDQVVGVRQALRVRRPLRVRVARRVPAQGQHVPHADRRVGADDVPELGDRMVHRGEVPHWGERGLLGDPPSHPDRAVPGRAARTVGDRDERRPQRLELPDRPPKLLLLGVALRRHELEREGLTAGRDQVPDGGGVPGRTGRSTGGRNRASRARRHASG